jgi:hypothetical protein
MMVAHCHNIRTNKLIIHSKYEWDFDSCYVEAGNDNERREKFIYEYLYEERRDSIVGIAGRPSGPSSIPGILNNILFSTSSRAALGPVQLPIQ